jgi:hypothetical protein
MLQYPKDLHDPLELFYNHSNKIYQSGFMYLLSFLDKTGRVMDGGWDKWWVELHGECLWMWRVAEEIAELTYKPEPRLAQILSVELEMHDDVVGMVKMGGQPEVVNISDGVVDLLPFPSKCIYVGLIA